MDEDEEALTEPSDDEAEDAPIQAAMRADAMLEKGDVDGYAVWKRVLKAVDELLRVELTEGERVN